MISCLDKRHIISMIIDIIVLRIKLTMMSPKDIFNILSEF